VCLTPPSPPERPALPLHAALPISGRHRLCRAASPKKRVPLQLLAAARASVSGCFGKQFSWCTESAVPPAWAGGRRCLRGDRVPRSEEHTSELQSRFDLVCRLLL